MSSLRSSLIRLAHSNPNLRSHLLPLLKEAVATKVPKEIVDPESGKNWEDLNAEYDATIKKMYEDLNALPTFSKAYDALSKRIDTYRKNVGGRLDRLRLRVEKAKRGLRLSSNPKHMAGFPSRGDWGYLGSDSTASAILRGDEVVGWVVGKESSTPVRAPGAMYSMGTSVSTSYTAYTFEGKQVGYGGSRNTNGALDEFHKKSGI